jgi:uncharacterized coiled-coil protein SlyX
MQPSLPFVQPVPPVQQPAFPQQPYPLGQPFTQYNQYNQSFPQFGQPFQQLPFGPQPQLSQSYQSTPQAEQPKKRTREEPEEDKVEIVEELDEEGRVKRRIVRQPKSSLKSDLSVVELIKQFDPLNTLAKLSETGIIKTRDDKEVLDAITKLSENFKEGMKELTDKMSSSIHSAIAAVAREQAPHEPEEDEKLKELKEHLAKQEELIKELQKQVIEEKHKRELEELKSEFEKKVDEIKELYNKRLENQRREYEDKLKEKENLISELKDKLSSLESELKAKKLDGTPSEVQVMHIRKEALDKVTSDLKSLAESFGENVVSPVLTGLVDVWKSQNLMNLTLMEQAGHLPPGTVKRLLEQRPVSREEVEKAKEKVSLLKQLKEKKKEGEAA